MLFISEVRRCRTSVLAARRNGQVRITPSDVRGDLEETCEQLAKLDTIA